MDQELELNLQLYQPLQEQFQSSFEPIYLAHYEKESHFSNSKADSRWHVDTLPSSPPLLVGSLQPVPKSPELTKTQDEHRPFIERGKIFSGLQVPKCSQLLCWVILSRFLKAPTDHNGPVCLSPALSLGCISERCWRQLVSQVDSLYAHCSLSPVLYRAPSPELTLGPCCSLVSRLCFYGPVTTCS